MVRFCRVDDVVGFFRMLVCKVVVNCCCCVIYLLGVSVVVEFMMLKVNVVMLGCLV